MAARPLPGRGLSGLVHTCISLICAALLPSCVQTISAGWRTAMSGGWQGGNLPLPQTFPHRPRGQAAVQGCSRSTPLGRRSWLPLGVLALGGLFSLCFSIFPKALIAILPPMFLIRQSVSMQLGGPNYHRHSLSSLRNRHWNSHK